MTQTSQEAQTSGTVEARLRRHGKVSYLEIPATDVKQSAAFYEQVFGWSVRVEGGHASFDDGDLIGHWVTGRSTGNEPGVLPYIYVDRVDETVTRIGANGGEVVREPYPEGDLWVATFRDPAGNVLGIWQAGPL